MFRERKLSSEASSESSGKKGLTADELLSWDGAWRKIDEGEREGERAGRHGARASQKSPKVRLARARGTVDALTWFLASNN